MVSVYCGTVTSHLISAWATLPRYTPGNRRRTMPPHTHIHHVQCRDKSTSNVCHNNKNWCFLASILAFHNFLTHLLRTSYAIFSLLKKRNIINRPVVCQSPHAHVMWWPPLIRRNNNKQAPEEILGHVFPGPITAADTNTAMNESMESANNKHCGKNLVHESWVLPSSPSPSAAMCPSYKHPLCK